MNGHCSQCFKGIVGTGEYVPITCGDSACQQGATCDNFHRNKRKKSAVCPAGKGCKQKVQHESIP